MQICRVEDITVEGLIKGSVIHFHLARTVVVRSSGTITGDGMGRHTYSSFVSFYLLCEQVFERFDYAQQAAKVEWGQVGF